MSNPWLTGFPFGSGSYPAGIQPWSGLPVAVSDGLAFYTPGQTISAEGLNYRFNQIENAVLYNASAVGNYHLVSINSYNPGTPSAWTGTSYSSGAVVTIDTFTVQPGDVIEVTAAGQVEPGPPATGFPCIVNGNIQLAVKEGSGAFVQFGSQAISSQYATSTSTTDGVPGTAIGTHTVGAGVTSVAIGVNGYSPNGGGAQVVFGLPNYIVKIWRPNP